MRFLFVLTFGVVVLATTLPAIAQTPSKGDAMTATYFRQETARLEKRVFADIETLEDWTSRREEYRRQLLEMLGLDPMPKKSPLNAVVTNTLERDGVVVENLHFQSMPGLYVTANLYRPSDQDGPLPAILYVCGHGGERENGVSLGNKTHYQHHGAWFARNGYVCLTIDTIQLGEIEGIHHGTYREKMWWWNNRGYSSAAAETLNCIRSLDYLQSRQEVDGDRIGVTGRSGGGAYSWWIAAVDDRIKVAVPVAGITSLRNHVVDGCVEGHCDCMFMVNTYRWDFPMVAALVAPRPLLISNSDKDRIFPLDGVVDVHRKVRKIYELYDAADRLGLQITEGPHKDTQELRIAAFRWMNRFLRSSDELIEDAAEPVFEKRELKVFETLPEDEIVSSIHESLVPKVRPGDLDVDSAEAIAEMVETLEQHSFRGWPKNRSPKQFEVVETHGAARARVIEFASQWAFRLPIFVFDASQAASGGTDLTIVGEQDWESLEPVFAHLFPDYVGSDRADPEAAEAFLAKSSGRRRAFLVPRGIGPTAGTDDERIQTQLRRRYMLLGQTLAGMRIYDTVCGINVFRRIDKQAPATLEIHATADAAVWAAYAALFVDDIGSLDLQQLPERNRDAPDILNVSRFVELADVVKAAESRSDGMR